MSARKFVLQETGIVLLGQVIGVGTMFGVFALLDAFHPSVLWGGLLGGFLATLNFFFMAVTGSLAADKAVEQNVKGGQALVRSSMMIRYLVLFGVLFAAGKSGLFSPIALAVPLIFVRPTLTIGEFFRKTGD